MKILGLFDIQRFSNIEESGSNALNLLRNIITKLGLKVLAEQLRDEKDASKWLKDNANPIIKFIGAFQGAEGNNKSKINDYATIISRFILVVDKSVEIIQVVAENPSSTVIRNRVHRRFSKV